MSNEKNNNVNQVHNNEPIEVEAIEVNEAQTESKGKSLFGGKITKKRVIIGGAIVLAAAAAVATVLSKKNKSSGSEENYLQDQYEEGIETDSTELSGESPATA